MGSTGSTTGREPRDRTTGGSGRRSPCRSPVGLSRREVEVLRVVAADKTNAEIATDLVIADKTVARHLSNVFSKLGVRSRTAADAFACERDLV